MSKIVLEIKTIIIIEGEREFSRKSNPWNPKTLPKGEWTWISPINQRIYSSYSRIEYLYQNWRKWVKNGDYYTVWTHMNKYSFE